MALGFRIGSGGLRLKKIREGKANIDELDYWTKGLLENGKIISDKRKEFFGFINSLSTSLGNFRFEFKPSEISTQKLLETNGREIAAAVTLIGPHRDDFVIEL